MVARVIVCSLKYKLHSFNDVCKGQGVHKY